MTGLLSAYIEHFPYLGLLVVLLLCGLGLPLPEDVALLAGGFLAHRGIIRYPTTLAISFLGVVAGDNSLFFLGRRFGTGLVKYFGLGRPTSMRRIERIQGFMSRHGHITIFYARFFAGLRALVYLTAGSFGVAPQRFLFYDVLGAAISVPVVVSAGYLFGSQIELAVRYLGGLERALWVVLLLSAGIFAMRMFVIGRERGEA